MNDVHHVDHPDDERYDAIAIFVVERWKESELSGDEWRFSWVAHFKRKGETIIVVSAHTLRWLLAGLEWRALIANEDGEIDREAWERTRDKCDQPGCPEVATLFYKRLKRYTAQGEELAPSSYHDGHEYRQFCERHRSRGDCGMDDADHNYNVILDPNM